MALHRSRTLTLKSSGIYTSVLSGGVFVPEYLEAYLEACASVGPLGPSINRFERH